MMDINTLLHGWTDTDHTVSVTGLSLDSRTLQSGQVFIALNTTAIAYVQQAVSQGACAVLYDTHHTHLAHWLTTMEGAQTAANCPFVRVPDLARRLGDLAARFYDYPATKLAVIGITGTNGKTSCSQFLAQLLPSCGIIGTLGWGTPTQLTDTGYTTPDALNNQAILATFADQAQHFVAMEVSSHGLAEGRVHGIRFKGVVLTNISRDHLDFHGSMDAYIAAKKSLFTAPETEFAVFNLDEPLSAEFIAVVPATVQIWGFRILDDLSDETIPAVIHNIAAAQILIASHVQQHPDGLTCLLHWQAQQHAVKLPLYGRFNVANVLAILTVALALGHSPATLFAKLPSLQPVVGRMQRVGQANTAQVFVDYAHTPDALEKALLSARQHCQGALWLVFGCGGDRDSGKRPQMGACAQKYADQIIITDDNPRSEDPAAITQAILSGCSTPIDSEIRIIHDRAAAIQYAIRQALPGDCVLIAGKGHERFQEYQQSKIHFSDADVVQNCLNATVTTA